MAEIGQKFGLSAGGGPFLGVRRPKAMAGMYIRPPHLRPTTSTFTTTANRYYSAPIYLVVGEVFSGAAFTNQSAGDTGEKCKIAVYSEAAGGGLGALAKNFGEVTLTAASALRQLASSWTVPTTGWYYLVAVFDSATAVYGAGQQDVAGSFLPAQMLPGFVAPNTAIGSSLYGSYVAGTYANFPESTGLTLTASVAASGADGTSWPDITLYG